MPLVGRWLGVLARLIHCRPWPGMNFLGIMQEFRSSGRERRGRSEVLSLSGRDLGLTLEVSVK